MLCVRRLVVQANSELDRDAYYLTISSSGGEGMMIVDPALPAAGSLTPVGLTSPPLDDDREISPKNAANTTSYDTTSRQLP